MDYGSKQKRNSVGRSFLKIKKRTAYAITFKKVNNKHNKNRIYMLCYAIHLKNNYYNNDVDASRGSKSRTDLRRTSMVHGGGRYGMVKSNSKIVFFSIFKMSNQVNNCHFRERSLLETTAHSFYIKD